MYLNTLTFRTGLSVITSLIIVFIIGGPLIKLFSEKMITGPIRQDGPIDHIIKKSGTPTMGGVIIIIGIIIKYNFMGRFNQYLCLDFNFCFIIFRCFRFIRRYIKN